jgi:uncharacterized membrane protein
VRFTGTVVTRKETFVSTLVAIVYDSEQTAKSALAELGNLQKQKLISLEDAVIATNEGGKIKLDQGISLASAGALGGAFWGGLIGLIFLMPLAGMAIGAATGAITGKLTDYGIDDNFIKELTSKVQPGKAALFTLTRDATPDKVLSQMSQFGGEVIQSNLSAEDEAKLQAALSGNA